MVRSPTRSRQSLRVWLACGIACQALLAQANAIHDDDDENAVPTAQVRLVPNLRGDLSVRIFTWNVPDLNLDTIRRVALPCDWRPQTTTPQFLDGVCRKYLAGDGALAHGTVSLATLAAALHQTGISYVRLQLDDSGVPLAEAPKDWKAIHSVSKPLRSIKSTTYEFWSLSNVHLPEPISIRMGSPWSPWRVAVPLAFTLLGPALLSLWLRRRAERKGAVESASVWVHWILTGMWLYWISAVSSTDIAVCAVHLQLESMLLTFLFGAALFAGVPLAAVASCTAILLRRPGAEKDLDTRGLVLRSVAREAVLMVPLGMFVVGAGMFEQDWHVAMLSLPAAFFTYKVLGWWLSRGSLGGIELLSRGPIREIASVIARRANVKLGGVYIIGSRSAREANAFAGKGNILALTRPLVEHLTCRELVAVLGHEIGHMKGKHVGTRVIAFWAYILLIGPLTAQMIAHAHLPSWVLSLPLLPLGYILATAFLSRKHEFSADAQAVELVDDAEGMIASLARLRKLSRSPVDWGGMQGSILSHPSMRDRVLAIARRFNVPEERALALLDNPDLLTADTPSQQVRFRLPVECTSPDLVFSSSWRQTYAMWARWAGYLVLAGITLAAGHFALRVWPRAPHVRLALLGALPVIAWLYLAVLCWGDRTAARVLREKLKSRIPQSDAGTFVGLIPGQYVAPVDGFGMWDAGFLFLAPDSLTYRGERTAFSIARADIAGISIGKGPLAWDRDHAVVIECASGSFSLSRLDRGRTWFQARALERRLTAWWKGESVENNPPLSPAAPPEKALLVSRSSYIRGWPAVRMYGTRAFFLCIGLTILTPAEWLRWTPAIAFVPFMTPLAYVVACLPIFFRPKPAAVKPAVDKSQVVPQPVEAAAQASAQG